MLSNRIVILITRVLVLVLIGIILVDLFFSSLSGSLSNYFEGHLPAMLSGVLILFLAALKPRYFSFRDDHEFIHIQSRSALLPFVEGPADVNFELLKKNIRSFEFKGWGSYQKMHIMLHNTYRGENEYIFSMSFISADQIESMRKSLNRAITHTQNQKRPSLASVG